MTRTGRIVALADAYASVGSDDDVEAIGGAAMVSDRKALKAEVQKLEKRSRRAVSQ